MWIANCWQTARRKAVDRLKWRGQRYLSISLHRHRQDHPPAPDARREDRHNAVFERLEAAQVHARLRAD